ncbi:MAG: hypothetical protein HYX76_08910 [Acidobacteria bacterium]|nr:hypothetical protein [Acidobacteriota bacterium]
MRLRRTLAAFTLALLLALVFVTCRGTENKPGPSVAAEHATGSEAAAPDTGIKAVYPSDAGTPDPLAQRLCDALHTLPQTRKAECCGTAGASTLAGECVRVLTVALRAKTVTIEPRHVDRCVEETRRALAGCDWVTPLMPRLPEACRALAGGQLQAGATCRSSLDCRDGLFCRGSSPTTFGVCAEPGGANATCGGPADTLATYVREVDAETRHPECRGFCRGAQCADYIAAGGSCSSDRQCAPGTHCASGRCVAGPLPKIGEPCSGSACAGDAVCSGGKCVALKTAGESCTSPFECEAACTIPPGAKVGTCGPECTNWPAAGYPGGVPAAGRKVPPRKRG